MSRHINFRDYSDEPVGGVPYDFLRLLPGVIAADRYSVIFLRPRRDNRFLAVRTYFRQSGIFFYFNAPSLVVRQVPMKIVDIMQCQHVDDFLHIVHGEKMPAYIDHEAPVTESRIVPDRTGGKRGSRTAFCEGQRLVNGLDSVKDTGFRSAFQYNLFGSDGKFVSFLVCNRTIKFQKDTVLPCGCGDIDICPADLLYIRGKKMCVSIWLIPCEVSVVIRQNNDDFFTVPAKSPGFPVDSCGFLMISRYFSLHF